MEQLCRCPSDLLLMRLRYWEPNGSVPQKIVSRSMILGLGIWGQHYRHFNYRISKLDETDLTVLLIMSIFISWSSSAIVQKIYCNGLGLCSNPNTPLEAAGVMSAAIPQICLNKATD